ncbi:hypothetical protein C0Q70_10048 [Pomacea canaliculata]|uniref:F5/8 type C domain-containing protein n=1 Tax=Pomacea canaliculata TaxID=400727 RepID=A0A2T7PBH2_POMCA|nr:hypothetical protein C0Q70_10048 [Pomacea canaliculata]
MADCCPLAIRNTWWNSYSCQLSNVGLLSKQRVLDLNGMFFVNNIVIETATESYVSIDVDIEVDIGTTSCGSFDDRACYVTCTFRRVLQTSTCYLKLNVTCDVGNVKGRYVRIRQINAAALLLCNVTVTGWPDRDKALKNFALNAPCSQCANYSNWTPDKAVDGNSQSCSQTDVWSKVYYSRHIHWWRVDLGKLILVSYIVITNTMDNCCSELANFTVELGSLESNGSITYTVCRYHDGVAGPLTSLNCTRSIWAMSLIPTDFTCNDVGPLTSPATTELTTAAVTSTTNLYLTTEEKELTTFSEGTSEAKVSTENPGLTEEVTVSTKSPQLTDKMTVSTMYPENTTEAKESTEHSSDEPRFPPEVPAKPTYCTCSCWNAISTKSPEEVQKEMSKTSQTLKMKPSNLAQQVRKKSSVPDSRLSSTVVGVVCGIGVPPSLVPLGGLVDSSTATSAVNSHTLLRTADDTTDDELHGPVVGWLQASNNNERSWSCIAKTEYLSHLIVWTTGCEHTIKHESPVNAAAGFEQNSLHQHNRFKYYICNTINWLGHVSPFQSFEVKLHYIDVDVGTESCDLFDDKACYITCSSRKLVQNTSYYVTTNVTCDVSNAKGRYVRLRQNTTAGLPGPCDVKVTGWLDLGKGVYFSCFLNFSIAVSLPGDEHFIVSNGATRLLCDRLANFTVELGRLESNGSITYTLCRYHGGVAGPLTTLNCTRSIWGQFVRISLMGVALTLCEVEVYGDMDDNSTRLAPGNMASLSRAPGSLGQNYHHEDHTTTTIIRTTMTVTGWLFDDWHMIIMMTRITTATPQITTATPEKYNYCACKFCNKTTKSQDEVDQKIKQTTKSLKVNNSALGKQVRKKCSASDHRVSATAMGIIGTTVLSFIFLNEFWGEQNDCIDVDIGTESCGSFDDKACYVTCSSRDIVQITGCSVKINVTCDVDNVKGRYVRARQNSAAALELCDLKVMGYPDLGKGSLANFTVELGRLESNGSITYTLCRYHDGVAGPLTTLNCTRSIWGQFVRISKGGPVLTLCEVEVYGDTDANNTKLLSGTSYDDNNATGESTTLLEVRRESTAFTRDTDGTTLSTGLTRGTDGTTVSTGLTRGTDGTTLSTGLTRGTDGTTVSTGLTRGTDGTTLSTGLSRETDETIMSTGLTKATDGTTMSTGLTRDTDETIKSTGLTRDTDETTKSTGLTRDTDGTTVSAGLTTETRATAELTPHPQESTVPTSFTNTKHYYCRCRFEPAKQNKSQQEAEEVVQITEELKVQHLTLGKQIRKKSSAADLRISSTVMGIVVTAVISFIFAVIVMCDLLPFCQFLFHKEKIGRGRGKV